MKNIVVFGASGAVGKLLVSQGAGTFQYVVDSVSIDLFIEKNELYLLYLVED